MLRVRPRVHLLSGFSDFPTQGLFRSPHGKIASPSVRQINIVAAIVGATVDNRLYRLRITLAQNLQRDAKIAKPFKSFCLICTRHFFEPACLFLLFIQRF